MYPRRNSYNVQREMPARRSLNFVVSVSQTCSLRRYGVGLKCARPFAAHAGRKRSQYRVSSCVEKASDWRQMGRDRDLVANEELTKLEEQLDEAWYADDEERMTEIRRAIDGLQPSTYVDILTSNLKFYKAFSSGIVVDVATCWLQAPDVVVMCKHPYGPIFDGFFNVISSFEQLFRAGISEVTPTNVRISLRGSVAFVTCDEYATPAPSPDADERQDSTAVARKYNRSFSTEPARIRMSAVNIFEKRNGIYYLVYHSSTQVGPPFPQGFAL